MKLSIAFGNYPQNLRNATLGLFFSAGVLTAQQTFTFTNAGASGSSGPTQNQVNQAYQSTNLSGSVTINTPGIQEFIIPASGAYVIEAVGASGYGPYGGRGAQMIGEFQFTAGHVLKILVGQEGKISPNYNAQYGGGGGSFVTDINNVPYVVAGGGGGSWGQSYPSAADAPTVTSGNTGGGGSNGAGGTNGSGGATSTSADGGGGFTGNGAGTGGGIAYINGGTGGLNGLYAEGGFGGGAGTSSQNNRRGGGGGGYSGGGGSEGGTTGFPEGGGGGSFNAGTNQINNAGVNIGHGRVIITKLCNVNISTSTNPICFGETVILNTNAAGTITWSAPGAGSQTSTIVSPTVTTTYSVTGTGTPNCIGTAVLVVTVMPLPGILTLASPPTVCKGKSSTLYAYGASNYTWSSSGPGGTMTVVNPNISTVYSVMGKSPFGCINTQTVAVAVSSSSLSVSPSTVVCEGTQVSLNANGAVTYTWSQGTPLQNIVITPSQTAVYTVTAHDTNNCQLSNTVGVTVNPRPLIQASADKSTICMGESVVISASGANTYSWVSLGTGSSMTLTLPVDVDNIYSVTGTDNNGCTGTGTVMVSVSKCTGLSTLAGKALQVYPNPARDFINIEQTGSTMQHIMLLDVTGREIQSVMSSERTSTLDITTLNAGVYFLVISAEGEKLVQRIIRE